MGCNNEQCSDTSNVVTICYSNIHCDYDYGDLPDFNLPGTYPTDITDGGEGVGAAHVILPDFFIGAVVDEETDGQPSTDALDDGADEDGVTLPTALFTGQTGVEVPITIQVPTGTEGQVVGWIDWNADGILSPGEAATSSIISGTTATTQQVTLSFDVPADANTTQPLGARFRLFDVNETNMSSIGVSLLGGEVEDYLVGVRPCPTQNCR